MAVAERLKWLLPKESDTSEARFRNGIGDVWNPKTQKYETHMQALGDWTKETLGFAGKGAMKLMRETVAHYGIPGTSAWSSGAAAADLKNSDITSNNLIALLYGLGRRGFKPSIGWAKTGHHDDGALLHAGGNAADIEFINGQSVDSWAGKQAAIALARNRGTRTLGLDPWMRSQKGTMAQIRAAMAAHGGIIYNEDTTHIHASSYPDAMAKHTKAVVKAVMASNQKPVVIHVRDATGANVFNAANALGSQ
jgi:hypothetical protein